MTANVFTPGLLRGKSAIITGGAGGIGRATAGLFAAAGARVAVFDIGANTQSFAAQLGPEHLGLTVDVSDEAACAKAVAEAAGKFGGLDILATMAGIVNPGGITSVSSEEYEQTMNSHVRGTFNMCRAAIPHLRQRKSGSIVCMSSIAAERGGGLRGGVHYAAAKAGILGLMKATARELAPDNIRVNAVCPGAIHTDKRVLADMNAMLASSIPMGRVGLSEEVAQVFLFLASDMASYITGATIDVNGGMHIH
jgi:NAD(P)-dependent dehydrogenase (short-subunit alcohol dehydrogenase family)